jgi:predicted transcriptional regulator
MSDEILKSIDSKLTVVSRLLALNVVKGRQLNEQMQILFNAGMSVAEIASTLGRTPNNVRVQLHLMKKKGKKEKSEENEKQEEPQ